jgi:flagellar capping protein FliD
MHSSVHQYTTVALTSLVLIFGSGCGKKGQLEYQTAQLKVSLTEQTSALKKLQADSLAVGNLGYYNIPQAGHLDQLRNKVKVLREETQSQTAEKEKVLKDIELLQKEMDTYRSRYLQ